MTANLPEEKIKSLYQMLFELATGNLAFRLPLERKKDGLDDSILLLNQLASEMQAALLEYGYVVPIYRYQNLVQLIFVLDGTFRIKDCSLNVHSLLGYVPATLIGKEALVAMLAPASKEYWNVITKEIEQQPDFFTTIHLIFQTKDRLLLPRYCSVSRLAQSDEIILTSLTTILEDFLYDLPRLKTKTKPKISEAETMQQLHDYIMANLDEPLPTIQQLSRIFKVNEFDLKHGFRTYFHTSIHKFYNEQRLNRALSMILQTDIPLKEIAFMSGFNSYLNFYKAFKKRFDYNPSAISRPSGQEP